MNSRPSPRFAVLEHSWNGVHWDLLLETVPEEPLRTWAIDAPIVFDVELLASSLADHRAIYLDYEGPIADGRGSVRRIDSVFTSRFSGRMITSKFGSRELSLKV